MVAAMLDREQLRAFAQRGFVVVPQVVPQELLATASRTIDELDADPTGIFWAVQPAPIGFTQSPYRR
jgi:hypothetical protein